MTSTLEAARAGDEAAFEELTRPYLRELHVHCYRMLGSFDDAEDLTQETLLSAWRGLARFAERSSLRAWLYRIATNRCLNAIRDGKRRPPPQPVAPFEPPEPNGTVEVPWLQPYPDERLDPASRYQSRETVELAFITALQTLPPRQTAALLLCDVLGYGLAEAAGMLDTSPTALKGVLQRARAAMPGPVPPEPVRADAGQARLARRFASAFEADDVDAVIALLTDDAWLTMPPAPHEYRGLAAIAQFLRIRRRWRGDRPLSLVDTRANGQPAFGCYLPDPDGRVARPTGIVVLTMRGDRIGGITRFLGSRLHRHFGLPDSFDVAERSG
ncbi:RNA polymerase subunit sigma-70 [Stackebrandtia nassauensis]|uniref:RNA polymerase sigma factor n=1 Tax=Stackebrandtia nassauensis (strain DSM 44728 / CIP 108903 / NRRL B-16338 / NBRC 102104 / LLR-40K-21) TaxID=446470 RepID=D3QAD0_STANL|nr:RNA polymerase subunit sigma-70 [Stackebrandtia nassauensis]ADD42713.1 RNA polymerase, sigma-24 subunit, ECF subfamily [Stackebrandtia nassauensis DSM 44728]